MCNLCMFFMCRARSYDDVDRVLIYCCWIVNIPFHLVALQCRRAWKERKYVFYLSHAMQSDAMSKERSTKRTRILSWFLRRHVHHRFSNKMSHFISVFSVMRVHTTSTLLRYFLGDEFQPIGEPSTLTTHNILLSIFASQTFTFISKFLFSLLSPEQTTAISGGKKT